MKKKGQIWIETVLYTLIGLSLIGITLAFITPKINEARDKAIVEQTLSSLNSLDEKINSILVTPGNTRIIDFSIKRGKMYINTSGDEIMFVIDDLSKLYSEEGVEIPIGQSKVTSFQGQKNSMIKIKISYSNKADLTFEGSNEEIPKEFNPASVPYKFSLTSKKSEEGFDIIDIKEVSGR